MAFQVSPGVNVSEIDLTTIVPAVSTSTAAIAGNFNWGPVEYPTLVSTEDQLVQAFGKPNANNYETFFTAADFLSYGNALYVSRAITSGTSLNAVTNTNSAGVSTILVKNIDYYNTTPPGSGLYVAKYPGALGNSLKISVCDSNTAFSSSVVGVDNYIIKTTFTTSSNVAVVTATRTLLSGNNANLVPTSNTTSVLFNQLTSGDYLLVGNASTYGTQYLQYQSNSATGNTTVTNITVSGGAGYEASNTFNISVTLPAGVGTTNATATVTSNSGGYLVGSVTITAPGQFTLSTQNNAPALTVSIANTTGGSIGVGSGETISVDFGVTANLNLTSNYTLSTTTNAFANSSANSGFTRYWEFYNRVNGAPGTSAYALGAGGAGDELHVVVVDQDGAITGVRNNILEVFQDLSSATDTTGDQGGSSYVKNVLNNQSSYVWYGGASRSGHYDALASATTYLSTTPLSLSFAGGVDSATETNMSLGDEALALDKFASAEDIDVSLILTGKSDAIAAAPNYIIDNICEKRKDCVVFISPDSSLVGSVTPLNRIELFISYLRASSYAVVDSGYKYRYDKYNDVYRYTPLNGDVAGTAARTDNLRDAWWSPAGFNRGQIKNIVRPAFNPNQAQRDVLYKASVNPVVTFPGQGTVLYGDKTFLNKPSAFDRINVRRLFIVLEKAISTAAKFTLFEFNDAFTRSQFKNLIEPYLRDVQGRRGIYDFRVVCDETNNTPEVIDGNRFVGDIYIKPARSINFIQLNFVAVRSGVAFEEIVGRF
jgi:phage tail sheath protein FI